MVTLKSGKDMELIASSLEGKQVVTSAHGNMMMCNGIPVLSYDVTCRFNGELVNAVHADELRKFIVIKENYLGLDMYPEAIIKVKYGEVRLTVNLEGEFTCG